MIYFQPGTQYDDTMQILKAFDIANGEWMGTYNSTTLVKGAGFPLLAALLHSLGIPLIQGCHLLYCFGAFLFAYAIEPIQKNRLLWFAAYLFVLFNPIGFSAQLTRYYRDIVYYALAFLALSAMLGMLLRPKHRLPCLLGGLFLASCVLTREDAHWLWIYCIACFLVSLLFAKKEFTKLSIWLRHILRQILLLVAGFACVALPVAALNASYYGAFVLDEYSVGPYAQAYGALSRLDGGLQDSRTTIPEEQRLLLYEKSPHFASLYPYLDAEGAIFETWKEIHGEYRTGYFSFVLRDSAYRHYNFENAEAAADYFSELAKQVNSYADTVDGAGPKRSGISARFYVKDIPSILRQTMTGLWKTVRYENISCIPLQTDADDSYLKIFEDFTKSPCAANRLMDDGSVEENYHLTGFNRWMQRGMRVLTLIYQTISPALFIAAMLWFFTETVLCFRTRTFSPGWIASASLFCVLFLRAAMIGFVDATTFSAIVTPSYQAGTFVALGMFQAFQLLRFFLFILQKTKKVKPLSQ